MLDTLSAVILQALAEVSGEEELEKIIKAKDRESLDMIFFDYATPYGDKCNVEYLRTAPEKRPAKLKNMPCDFLQEDGECMLGECRPLTCRNYPYTNQPDRLFSLFGMLDSITVCPVAYEIWERLKDIYGLKRKK